MAREATSRRRLKAITLVERQVHSLLELSPAYRQVPPDKQREIATNMVRIGSYLVEPEHIAASQLRGAIAIVPAGEAAKGLLDSVNFPEFVAGLISGVFQAIVDSSIRQMEAYADLIKDVAKKAGQFAKDSVTDQSARDWLATTYPDYLEQDTESGGLRLRPGLNRAEAIKRFRLLPLCDPLRKLSPGTIEDMLVPAARRRIAAARQQLLASMVLMGVNR